MTKKQWLIVLTILFVLSLVPLYLIGQYAHPSVDDYFYGAETAAVFKNTGSFFAVIKEAYQQTLSVYGSWQGNFSAVFLMHLQPAIYGEGFYWLTCVILLTAFSVSMLLFFYVVLTRRLHAKKPAAFAAGLAVTFSALQFVYRASDSFYWYNGGIYYTFFYSLMLFLLTLVTLFLHSQKTPVRIFTFLLSLILAFCIGGGNYSTALFTALLLFFLAAVYLFRKQRKAFPVLTVALFALSGLFISMIAPGNALRQAAVGEPSGVWTALLYSFAYGGYNIASATTVPVAVLWLLLLPLFYRFAKNSRFSFRCPLLVLIVTFCLYCAQGTPVFYAQGIHMPYRMMNIIYFSYYPFMTFNLIYLTGYLARQNRLAWLETLYDGKKIRNRVFLTAAAVFFAGCVGRIEVSDTAEFSGFPLTASAVYSLLRGDLATYDAECADRDAYLQTMAGKEVVLQALTVTPEPVFHTDITTDPSDWRNQHLALYYHLTSVKLAEPESSENAN